MKRRKATYRGFRKVSRTGNWWNRSLWGRATTVFLTKYGKWGVLTAGRLVREWFDSPYEAMDWAIDEADGSEIQRAYMAAVRQF